MEALTEFYDLLDQMLADPTDRWLVIGGAVLVLAVLSTLVKKARAGRGKKVDPKIKRLLEKGLVEQAANMELKNGNFPRAIEYFLRAQKPLRAAQVAQRMERPRQAGELYEKAGDLERASKMYKLAGMDRRAEELIKSMGPVASLIPDDAPYSSADSDDSPTFAEEEEEEEELLPPAELAERAEKKFMEALSKGKDGDARALEMLDRLGREAVEALLSIGETRRAAEICVDAGLIDQAINLYVNLLGDPGAAASLLAERGDHERAAELYEAAGKKERALASWLEWSKSATDPLINLGKVERLGEDTVFRLLETVAEDRPANQENADLHYRIAKAYEERARVATAVAVLEQIASVVPSYRDVEQKLAEMRVVVEQAGPEEPPAGDLLGQPVELEEEDKKAADIGTARTLLGMEALKPPGAEEDQFPDLSLDSPGGVPPADFDQPADAGSREDQRRSLEEVVDQSSLKELVSEVATAAAKEATAMAWAKQSNRPPVSIEIEAPSSSRRARKVTAQGIEPVSISLKYVHDPMVQAAKQGPRVNELLRLIGNSVPDLKNIELFYQLGLAQAASGQWLEARQAFDAVQEASPGYRDAGKRAEELGRWQQTVPSIVEGQSLVNAEQPQRYKLLGEIGRGGMAVVYRAHDEALDREVALKFLSEDISSDKKMLEMFRREARASAQLNHPNIVTVFDVGTLKGRDFICMELVEGTTVEDMMEQSGQKLKVIDALRVTENILCALDYAHSKQIIHRDIKPSNMMRNDLGVVKLMDFGLAKSIKSQAKTTLIAGTPNYMPPEQFTGKDMDASSDLFAVGASLYEMLTGSTPFDGMDRSQPPKPLKELNPAVPKLLERIVHRSIELDKKNRFHAAREMLMPIRRIIASVSDFLNKQAKTKKSQAAGSTTS